MRKTLALTAALIAAMACGDVTGPLGPLGFGVIKGKVQEATAGDPELPEPAVARVWRDASGQAFLGAGPLYAQTDVTGVVGAVVCVGEVAIEGEPIQPHARCTSTEVDGTATFHLTPPTKAGRHRTPIVAEVNGVALTPDTVTAVVEAGPVSDHPFVAGWSTTATFEDFFTAETVQDTFGNAIPWIFATDCACITLGGTFTNWPAARSIAPAALGSGALHVLLSASDTLASGTVNVTEPEPGVLRWTIAF